MNKPNVLFILIDTLRANNLSCYGYHKKTSPNIDGIASKGTLFNNAFVCMNASDPALTSIFTGLYPHSHGIIHHGVQIPKEEIQYFEENKIKLLPEILKERGYKTVGLDWLGRWHRNGFDYYEGLRPARTKQKKRIEDLKKIMEKIKLLNFAKKIYSFPPIKSIFGKTKGGLANDDFLLTKKAIDFIKKTNDPFFLFIHYWGIHIPYNCPKNYVNMFYENKSHKEKSFDSIKNKKLRDFYETCTRNEKNFGQIEAKYDGSIKYVDDQIGMIMQALTQSKKEDNTIIVIMSDHGESLTEHNILFDHHGLYDVTTKVPLIIKNPKQTEPKKINALVQQIDIMPTLLSMLNININTNFDGINMTPLISGQINKIREHVCFEENYYEIKKCIRTKTHKLILAENEQEAICTRCGVVHGGLKEFYDLGKDQEELNNIYDGRNKVIIALRNKLNKFTKESQHMKTKKQLHKAISDIKF